jgi:hypothetical protein
MAAKPDNKTLAGNRGGIDARIDIETEPSPSAGWREVYYSMGVDFA